MTVAEMTKTIRRLCESYGSGGDNVDAAAERMIANAETLLAELAKEGVSEEEACEVAVNTVKQAFVEELPNERGFLWERA